MSYFLSCSINFLSLMYSNVNLTDEVIQVIAVNQRSVHAVLGGQSCSCIKIASFKNANQLTAINSLIYCLLENEIFVCQKSSGRYFVTTNHVQKYMKEFYPDLLVSVKQYSSYKLLLCTYKIVCCT